MRFDRWASLSGLNECAAAAHVLISCCTRTAPALYARLVSTSFRNRMWSNASESDRTPSVPDRFGKTRAAPRTRPSSATFDPGSARLQADSTEFGPSSNKAGALCDPWGVLLVQTGPLCRNEAPLTVRSTSTLSLAARLTRPTQAPRATCKRHLCAHWWKTRAAARENWATDRPPARPAFV